MKVGEEKFFNEGRSLTAHDIKFVLHLIQDLRQNDPVLPGKGIGFQVTPQAGAFVDFPKESASERNLVRWNIWIPRNPAVSETPCVAAGHCASVLISMVS